MIVLGTPLDRVGLLFDLWEGDIADDWQKLHVPSTECPRISQAFLDGERTLLGEAIFRREYLAEFTASKHGMFDHELVQAALLPDEFDLNGAQPAGTLLQRRAIDTTTNTWTPAYVGPGLVLPS